MNKNEYLALTLEQQVSFINEKMKSGKSLRVTCANIPVAKSGVSTKFKNHGYKLIENQYILQEVIEQQNFTDKEELLLDYAIESPEKETNLTKGKVKKNKLAFKKQDLIPSIPDNIQSDLEDAQAITEPAESIKNKHKNGVKKVGRPQKYKKDSKGKNIDKKKFTIEIDKKVYKALKRKKNEEAISINSYVEELLRQAIEDKYFNPISE